MRYRLRELHVPRSYDKRELGHVRETERLEKVEFMGWRAGGHGAKWI